MNIEESDELVLRSFYLPARDDRDLRRVAYLHNVSKGDLIRALISVNLANLLDDNTWQTTNEEGFISSILKQSQKRSIRTKK